MSRLETSRSHFAHKASSIESAILRRALPREQVSALAAELMVETPTLPAAQALEAATRMISAQAAGTKVQQPNSHGTAERLTRGQPLTPPLRSSSHPLC